VLGNGSAFLSVRLRQPALAEDLSELCWDQAETYDDYCDEIARWTIVAVSAWATGHDDGYRWYGELAATALGDVCDEILRYVGADHDPETTAVFNRRRRFLDHRDCPRRQSRIKTSRRSAAGC
jgi:hypothetical protein